ncbi:DUF4332 domain-containing protein [Yoonia sp. F2084L]|uniref:DUF4332 domain-containing protein n=1 Tax=Yoonia sp. F2084L TaxID=2926419 RepID=UPI001FF5EF29|nr:DUF4332 domain-containing protein [Yoonia sp. F2084L]MCK0097428.1 DUF4332 domain-containing protein [Yoonia sp. F2084L]
MTRYYLDERGTDLDALQDRLQRTDLIPSHEPLLDGLSDKLASLKKAGVTTLANLRCALKAEKSLTSLSERSGVDAGYLRLLKRTINGFIPKPRSLREMDWLGADVTACLSKAGIKNTRHVFEAACGEPAKLARNTGISPEDARDLLSISDLCRIQWVSPNFARALVAAGNADPATVAAADPETLFEAIKKANHNARFYKGTVGLRDIKRLVVAARYVP